MSFRINLSTFNLSKLQALFGSEDEALIETIDKKLLYLEDTHVLEPKDYRIAHRALEIAIQQGLPVVGLKNEGYGHVELANLLANRQQRHYGLDCDFKYFGVKDFWDKFSREVEEPGRSLFDVFLKGRPLFGAVIPPRLEIRYGYLANEEVHLLAVALKLLVQQHESDLDVFEVAGGYLKCLEGVCRGKRDLWIQVC